MFLTPVKRIDSGGLNLKEQVVSINRVTKVVEAAKKNLRKVHVLATSIQHPVLGTFGSGKVLLKPAPAGTGVIAGGPVRAVITAVGIPNVLTKSLGSHN